MATVKTWHGYFKIEILHFLFGLGLFDACCFCFQEPGRFICTSSHDHESIAVGVSKSCVAVLDQCFHYISICFAKYILVLQVNHESAECFMMTFSDFIWMKTDIVKQIIFIN